MKNLRLTNKVRIGSLWVGGNEKIAIQSMTNTPTKNYNQTLDQIKELHKEGCDIIRIAVPDMESACIIDKIVENSPIPVIADIHFDYKLALEAIKRGIHALRLNPGNIKNKDKIELIVSEAKEKDIAIRIGVNSGSLNRKVYKEITPVSMVDSALEHITILENLDFNNIKISLKASDIWTTVESYRLMSKIRDYPLHLGVTEAGTRFSGTVKSAIGIGILLFEGIGDTIRVSLTDNPIQEVRVAKEILKSLDFYDKGVSIISCPTCARSEIDVISLAQKIEEITSSIDKKLKIAVMGCAVNGPGEAMEADLGIAGGKKKAFIFKKGKVVEMVNEDEIIPKFLGYLNELTKEG